MNNEFLVKKVMPIVLIIVVAMTMLIMIYGNKTGNTKPNNKSNKEQTTVEPGDYDTSFTGVITSIDTEKNEIVIYNLKLESKLVLNYNGGTDVRNKYGKVVAMSHMEVGQIVDAGYVRKDMKLVMLHESDDCWEYKNLTNFAFRESGNVIYINGKRYGFDENISITMDGVLVDRSKILPGDEVTVRGEDNEVYSIVVTKGHGTLKLDNYEELVGGLIMVGNYDAVEIVDDMSMEVGEGTYNVWFVNGDLKGEKTVTISRNETTKVDVGDIYLEESDTALVNFRITPSNAILYVDGVARKYNNAVELEYGTYTMDVEKDGYNSYSGKVIVDQSTVSIVVNLVANEDAEDEKNQEDSTQKPTSSATQNEDTSNSEATKQPTQAVDDNEETNDNSNSSQTDDKTNASDDANADNNNDNSGDNTDESDEQSAETQTPEPEPTYSSDATQYADGSGGVG